MLSTKYSYISATITNIFHIFVLYVTFFLCLQTMYPDHQKNKILLSRYFDENTYLVAGMCSKCYNECNDVKIVGINQTFLSKVNKNTIAKDLKHCEADFFELDYDISNNIENCKAGLKDIEENQEFVEENGNDNDGMKEFHYSNPKNSIKHSFACFDSKLEPLNEENQAINNFKDRIRDLETSESEIFYENTVSPIKKEEPILESIAPKLLDAAKHLLQHADDIKECSDVSNNSPEVVPASQSSPSILLDTKELILAHTDHTKTYSDGFYYTPTSSIREEGTMSYFTLPKLLDAEEHLMQYTDDGNDDLEKKFCSKFESTPKSSFHEIEDFHSDKAESFGGCEHAVSKINYTLQEIQDIIGVTSQNWCVDSGYFDNYCASPPKQKENDSSSNISKESLKTECEENDLVYSKYFLSKAMCNGGTMQLSQTSEFQGFDSNELENSNHVKVKMKEMLWKIENDSLEFEEYENFSLEGKKLNPNQSFPKILFKNYEQINLKPLISNADPTMKDEVFKKCGKTILDVKKEIENLDLDLLKNYSDNYTLTPPIWHPPKSPHNLIEEDLYHDPWQLLVATIFLNRTSAKCARRYIKDFLLNYPNPFEVLRAVPSNFEQYFKKLGLQTVRSLQVWKMSHDFVTKDWKNVTELHGVGRYGRDAFNMFCLGNFDVQPEDRYLKIYKAWYEKVYNRKSEDFDEKFGGAVGYRNQEWLLDESNELGDDLCGKHENRESDKEEISR